MVIRLTTASIEPAELDEMSYVYLEFRHRLPPGVELGHYESDGHQNPMYGNNVLIHTSVALLAESLQYGVAPRVPTRSETQDSTVRPVWASVDRTERASVAHIRQASLRAVLYCAESAIQNSEPLASIQVSSARAVGASDMPEFPHRPEPDVDVC